MTKTLQATLTPLLIIGSFCSLCLFEYPLRHSRPYLSYLYFLAIWSCLTYSVYYPILSYMEMIAAASDDIAVLITVITSTLELKMCLHELSLVDDTMEVIGAPKEYQRLRKWISRIIIGWIVYIFYTLAVVVYRTFLPDYYPYILFEIFVNHYSEYVHFLNALIWKTILGLVDM